MQKWRVTAKGRQRGWHGPYFLLHIMMEAIDIPSEQAIIAEYAERGYEITTITRVAKEGE